MKLLCVGDFGFPPQTGGDQAVFNAIRLLQDRVEIHIFFITNGNVDIQAIKNSLPNVTITTYNIRNRNIYENIRALFSRIVDFSMFLFGQKKEKKYREGILGLKFERYASLYEAINKYIIEKQIDIVQFEFYQALFWGQTVIGSVKKVFVQHEIQFIVEQQRLGHHNHTWRDIMKYEISKNREIMMMNGFDAVITLSDTDAKILVDNGVKSPVFPSFAKVQLRNAVPCDYRKMEQIDLVFVGPEAHEPNKQGMTWFMENVWETISSRISSLNLHIIGKWTDSTKDQWKKKYKNVIFEGFVPDLVNAIQGRVLIVPIFEGSGIRMKILEAANIGVPFISTSIGSVGLNFENGKNCIIANTKKEFIEAIMTTQRNRDLLQSLANAAYQHVTADFSDEKFVESRMKAYLSLYN